jgi:hypothetical protein
MGTAVLPYFVVQVIFPKFSFTPFKNCRMSKQAFFKQPYQPKQKKNLRAMNVCFHAVTATEIKRRWAKY